MELPEELTRILDPDRVLTRAIDRIAYANDASVYRLVPTAVVRPRSLDEVRELFRVGRRHRIPLTFRAAGTSLSGQAVTDGILVDLSRDWRRLQVLDDGGRVRVQPGVIGGSVNDRLRPYRTKIGPDPASINACMMGGILANNSSGMCCGTVHNAYHTLESMVFVLPDGVVVDSADAAAEERFAAESPAVARGLLELRDRIEVNADLVARIRRKYRIKNTMGYSLNAFLDHATPVAILSHLMIGSEGTLGFIAEAVLRTVPDPPHRYTGLLFLPDVPAACAAIAPLRDSGAATLELMDRASLRAIQDQPGVPPSIRDLPGEAAALLVEYQGAGEDEVRKLRRSCERLLPGLPAVADPIFTERRDHQAALWKVRKGLIPTVGAVRAHGTSMIIEDVAFPIEALADGVRDLQQLCSTHRYHDAIVFGHAKDGNLHFVLNQAFTAPADVDRYDRFMRDLADTVAVRYGGALKAEHGTGRNMAPFVEAEWGPDACDVMRALKSLIDPSGTLNPGVILNDDPDAHVTDLKSLPSVEDEVDPCIECGFCERMCPSRDLTLTPRQRIVVRREIARLRQGDPGSARLRHLETDFQYAGLDTCAADGLCATACPVGIDTGRLVKRLRGELAPSWRHRAAVASVDRFGLVESVARLWLRAGGTLRAAVGDTWTRRLSGLVRRISGVGVPLGDPLVRTARGPLPACNDEGAAAVYFPACASRVLGPVPPSQGDRSLPVTLVEVVRRAGCPVRIPKDVGGHCCGLAFASRGYRDAYRKAVNRTVRAAWTWTEHGRLPLVVDTSPCAYTLRRCREDLSPSNRERWDAIRIVDSVEYALDAVVPNLVPKRRVGSVTLHPVCSAVKAGIVGTLETVAASFAHEVRVPPSAGCCGFAGDRGFVVPQLTAAATAGEAAEVRRSPSDGYYSSSPTCEIGMSRATGKAYRSIWYLLDEATR